MPTAGGDLDLLHGRGVEDAAGLEETNVLLAIVLDGGLHRVVSDGLELDIKLAVGDIAKCSCGNRSGASEDREKLHDERGVWR